MYTKMFCSKCNRKTEQKVVQIGRYEDIEAYYRFDPEDAVEYKCCICKSKHSGKSFIKVEGGDAHAPKDEMWWEDS